MPANGSIGVDLVLELQSTAPPAGLLDRHVVVRADYHIDDDDVGADPTLDGSTGVDCTVSPSVPEQTVSVSTPCVGSEVKLEVRVTCSLPPAGSADFVHVRIDSILTEGKERKHCGDNDFAGNTVASVDVPFCDRPNFGSCTPTQMPIVHVEQSAEVIGNDFADVRYSLVNYLPTLSPQNFRQVNMEFEGTVHDDEWFGSVDTAFNLMPQCRVDPFHRFSSFRDTRCSDNEVLFVVEGMCILGDDDTSVDMAASYSMFEGTSCAPVDLDDHASREFSLSPCDVPGSCASFTDSQVLDNRGDSVHLESATYTNIRQP